MRYDWRMEALIALSQEPIFRIVAGIFGLVALFHWWSGRRHPSRSRQSRRSYALSKADPLIVACQGDRAQADRLMMYEIRRQPGISKAEARHRALERLVRDRSGYS